MSALRTILAAAIEGAFLVTCILWWFVEPSKAATRLPDMASEDAMTLVLYMMIVVCLAVSIIAKALSRRARP